MKTKLHLQDESKAYSEFEVEYIVSKIRSGNISGSCILKCYDDEAGTKEIYVNLTAVVKLERI